MPPQRRGIGFVFQHYAAFKHLTVRDNVGFGLKIRKRPKAEIKEKVDNLLEVVGLSRIPDPLSEPAVRRAAAAHGAGARTRRRPAGAAARRAVRCAGRQGPRGSAGLAAPAARRGARHHGAGHPRPGRGARRRRPDRGAQQGPHRAGRFADRRLRHAGQRVRDVVPRRGVVAERNAGAPARHSRRPQPRYGDRHRRRLRAGHRCAEGHHRPNRHAGLRGSRRADQRAPNNTPFTAQITRGDAEALGLNEGDTVYVRATRVPALPGGTEVPKADTADEDEDEALSKA